MKRVFLLFLLFLAACGGTEPDTAVSPTGEDSPIQANTGGDTAVTFAPAVTVDEAAQLREFDQTHGAAEPVVTIIEYGDFQ